MRHISKAGLELIKRFEGFSPIPYLDAAGLPTIGFGHLIRGGEIFDTISRAEAETILRADVCHAERAVLRLTDVPLMDGQYDSLVSFTFNLGSGAFQRSTLRQKINREEHEAVPDEFRRWIWANGRKLRGLMRRREAEIKLYCSNL